MRTRACLVTFRNGRRWPLAAISQDARLVCYFVCVYMCVTVCVCERCYARTQADFARNCVDFSATGAFTHTRASYIVSERLERRLCLNFGAIGLGRNLIVA